jgi:argininosuccinate lyase
VGIVWAIRRSLRLLSLLTLMASALCSGQTLAAQDITAEDLAPALPSAASAFARAHTVVADAVAAADKTGRGMTSITASVIRDIAAIERATAPILIAPAALQRPARDFSPRIERAPPLA